jgi:hypothetical protein
METLGNTLFSLGIAIVFASLIWSFVVIFKDNKFLAVLCLFLPMGLPVTMLLWWPKTWKPLAAWGIGLALLFGGMACMRAGE